MGEKRDEVSPVNGPPVDRPSTKKGGYGKDTPHSMKVKSRQQAVDVTTIDVDNASLLQEEIKVVALLGTDVKISSVSSINNMGTSTMSYYVSSIHELDDGELIQLKVNDGIWLHGRVSDVTIFWWRH